MGGGPLLRSKTQSQSHIYARLLTEEDLNRVKDRFQEDTDFALEEAIRKHVRVFLFIEIAQRASHVNPLVDIPSIGVLCSG